MRLLIIVGALALSLDLVHAAECKRSGYVVSCDDGRAGTFTGDAIIWPDGTRSSSTPHASVQIGRKDSVRVGAGVFVGSPSTTGLVPLDDPNAPHKRSCAVLDGISYCH